MWRFRRRPALLVAWTLASPVGFPSTRAEDPPPAPVPPPAGAERVTEPTPTPIDPVPDQADRARLSVRGLGWLENLEMKNVLRQVRPGREAPIAYDASFIEDGAFMLLNRVRRLGYLRARLRADLLLQDGRRVRASWGEADDPPLPREWQATEVRFEVDPGLRYFYEELEFVGIDEGEAQRVRAYFVRTDGLLKSRVLRRFSRAELDEGVTSLRTALRNDGFLRAEVTVDSLRLDDATGAAYATLRIDKGPRHRIGDVEVVVRETADGPVRSDELRRVNRPFSRPARDDLEQELLESWFHQGYPDASIRLAETASETGDDGTVEVDLRADVVPGPRVRLGEIRFTSPTPLRHPDSLERRARLEGPWLDRLEADEARSRLARLGGYRFVRVRYDASSNPATPDARDVVYDLEPGKLLTVDLLAGYRSYDLLYGGFDALRRNLFGLGHSAELRAVQSFKSTEAYVTYSIPDVILPDLTVYALGDVLVRDEVSFHREELRSGLGLRRAFTGSGHQAGIRYSYEILRAGDVPSDIRLGTPGERQPDVGAVVLDWTLDRRDSALEPREGFRLAANLEVALPELGGESSYLRPDVAASFHLPLGGGRFLSVGARWTVLVDATGDDLMPFNKRIFPGGEDSVRGYQRGEAGPQNAAGDIIGAETALVWNLEFEQRLTPTWSLVTFADGVAEAAVLDDFPADEVLWSIGGGIRWHSVIGPIRLEYGRNLNRRRGDPPGTLHFSVGFPF